MSEKKRGLCRERKPMRHFGKRGTGKRENTSCEKQKRGGGGDGKENQDVLKVAKRKQLLGWGGWKGRKRGNRKLMPEECLGCKREGGETTEWGTKVSEKKTEQ